MINRSIILLDTETTGLDPSLGCEVIEIAATAINYWDLSDHHAGTFHHLIKPARPEKAQPGAIEKTGDLFEKAKATGLAPKVVWTKFVEYCETVNDEKNNMGKPIIMAWNLGFDQKFIKHHLIEYKTTKVDALGLHDYPWSFEFDAMFLGYQLFESDFYTQNVKLDTILAKLGLSREGKTHNALEDILLMKQAVKRLMTFNRTCAKLMKLPNDLPKK